MDEHTWNRVKRIFHEAVGRAAETGWSAQRSAEHMRATAVVASAAAAADPLLKALLVLEVADRPDTPGLLSVAREAANVPLPMAVLRGHERTLTDAAFSPDSTRMARDGRSPWRDTTAASTGSPSRRTVATW